MLRVLSFLFMLAIVSSSILALDYSMQRKQALAAGQSSLSVQVYFADLGKRVSAATKPRKKPEGPAVATDLAILLPRTPEGWTQRPAVVEDIDSLLAKNRRDNDRETERLFEDIAKGSAPDDGKAIAVTYERDGQRVIFKLARHPDDIFTSAQALDRRAALETAGSPYVRKAFMRVRGWDISEENLPEAMRARLFTADLGAQVRLWVLAPERMPDQDLLPFFETLDVAGLNAMAVNREPGVGAVPVLVLVSEMDETARAAYDADRSAQAAERKTRRAEARAALAATLEQPEDPPEPEIPSGELTADCRTDKNGTKRCKADQ